MVFQNYALYPHMTVRENIAFPLKLAKVDPATIDKKVEDVAQTLDLTQHLDRKPANLSGGQRQRVAMGRAIVREPKAFLMDEPLKTGLGDIPLPDDLQTALKEAKGSGKLIAGIRPEHLEDASLLQDRSGGVTFKANVDLVESLGSEVYVYFTIGEGRTEIAAAHVGPETGIEELPRSTRPQMVARLEPNTTARRGGVAELWFDPGNLHPVDGQSGKRIGA